MVLRNSTEDDSGVPAATDTYSACHSASIWQSTRPQAANRTGHHRS